jgi:hypothetical protein
VASKITEVRRPIAQCIGPACEVRKRSIGIRAVCEGIEERRQQFSHVIVCHSSACQTYEEPPGTRRFGEADLHQLGIRQLVR